MLKIFRTILTLCIVLIASRPTFAGNLRSDNTTGTNAPNFYLKDLQGNAHFLNDYCGEKKSAYRKNEKNVVLLSFFATWCLPCKKEYPILKKLSKKYEDKKLKVFLINIEEERKLVEKYVQKQNITLTVLLDRFGVANKKYEVESIPQLFLIEPDQNIVWEKNGFDPEFPLFETLETKIDSLLKVHFLE